jgi:integrase
MASLTRKPTSKFWFACFRDRNGKQHRVSTGEERKSVAKKIAQQFELVATRKTSRKALWETLNELQQIVGGEENPVATVSEFFKLWLNNRTTEGVTVATNESYSVVTSKFLEFLGQARASQSIIEIAKRDIEAFRNQLVEGGLSPSTVNRNTRVLRMVFKVAKADGYVFENPCDGLRAVKGDHSRTRRPFTLEEIQTVLDVADPEWQSLVKLGLYTGHRLGDLALLQWQNVDYLSQSLRIFTRKTGAFIQLPIVGPLRDHLLSLNSADDPKTPLHPRAYALVKERKGRVIYLSNEFADLLAEAGLRPPRIHAETGQGHSGPRRTSELSFHSLRHTAVSLLKASGVPHAVAQALVGHESEAISQNYTHVGTEALSRALEKFPTL